MILQSQSSYIHFPNPLFSLLWGIEIAVLRQNIPFFLILWIYML